MCVAKQAPWNVSVHRPGSLAHMYRLYLEHSSIQPTTFLQCTHSNLHLNPDHVFLHQACQHQCSSSSHRLYQAITAAQSAELYFTTYKLVIRILCMHSFSYFAFAMNSWKLRHGRDHSWGHDCVHLGDLAVLVHHLAAQLIAKPICNFLPCQCTTVMFGTKCVCNGQHQVSMFLGFACHMHQAKRGLCTPFQDLLHFMILLLLRCTVLAVWFC